VRARLVFATVVLILELPVVMALVVGAAITGMIYAVSLAHDALRARINRT
jgi:tetrahydromethanopterin S-methyltransferase subunit E